MRWWSNLPNIFKSRVAEVAGAIWRRPMAQGYSATRGAITFEQAVHKGYKNLVWVHRCVAELGAAVGSVPWKAYKRSTTGKLTWIPDHPLSKLIERPNPFYTRKELMESWAIYLSLAGNSYFEVVYANKKPYQLYALRPDWMIPQPDPIEYLSGYKMDAGIGPTGKKEFEVGEILHYKYLDPENEYVGLSPLAAAKRTLMTEDSAIRWNQTIFDNSAVPNGILKLPATGVKKPERDKLREELEKEFTQENMNRPMILWGGMEWQKMAMDAKDLDFLNQRQLNKYEICAILQTPPQIVGANEDPTYANYDVARTAYWEDNIIPKLEWFQARANVAFSPYFDGVELRYDISDVPAMRVSFGKKVDTAKTLWMMGYPINAINRRVGLGFDDVPWGDAWWAQMNMMPVTSLDSAAPLLNPSDPANTDPGAGSVDPFSTDPITQ